MGSNPTLSANKSNKLLIGSVAFEASSLAGITGLLQGFRKKVLLRNAGADDFGAIVELNQREVQQTSPMDLARLRELAQISSYHKVAVVDGRIAAFLLAMREDAPYLNDNYAWFAARFPQFIYVDRIVVSLEFAGLKIGSQLYEDLFDYARSQGIKAITCEYNVRPPNPASQRFHDRFGFKELGQQWVAHGTKLVSLQVAEVSEAAHCGPELPGSG